MDKIPILDLSKLKHSEDIRIGHSRDLKNDPTWIGMSVEIRKILSGIGFVQLVNHGIPAQKISAVFQESKMFFNLPQEVKNKYAKNMKNMQMNNWFGYTQPGQENLNIKGSGAVFEFRETYDWLEGTGIYPDYELPNFSSAINELHEECKKLAKKVFRLCALGLDLEDPDFFIRHHHHWLDPEKVTGLTNMKVFHYPEISRDVELPKRSVRIHEHTDINSLSFVFQEDVGGLEVKTLENEWIPVDPISGAIVVNTGKLMEFWTGGIFPATPHRILIPDIHSKNSQSRYSIGYFSGPDIDTNVCPLQINLTDEEKARMEKSGKKYISEPTLAGEYVEKMLKFACDTAYIKN